MAVGVLVQACARTRGPGRAGRCLCSGLGGVVPRPGYCPCMNAEVIVPRCSRSLSSRRCRPGGRTAACEVTGHGLRRPLMDLSWTCGCPGASARSGSEVKYRCYQRIHASTRTPARREPLSDEGFQAEDRHNPLPHIALSTTAPKSAYKNTAFLSTNTSAELRELQDPG